MANRINQDFDASPTHVSLSGHLLVAAPHVLNEKYQKTVFLVVHHNEQGAVGIALNRGFDHNIEGLWEQLSGGKADYRQGVLHFGGPNSGPVIALHNSNKYAEFETSKGVYLAAQVHNLQALLLSSLSAAGSPAQGNAHAGDPLIAGSKSASPQMNESKASNHPTASGVPQKCAVKIIVGQAEWAPGVLDYEFATGQWLPLPVSPAIVFAEPTVMWPLAMRAIGNQFVCDLTGAVVPPHASLN